MEEKNVKRALDAFEQDDFLSAKEILAAEIRKSKNEYIKGKLDLKDDPDDEK